MPIVPVRSFDGVDDRIRCLPGAADITGAWSVAALLRPAASGWYMVTQGHDSGGAPAGYALQINTSWRLGSYSAGGGGEPFSSTGFVPSDGWAIVAVTKASGSAFAAFHAYSFATGTWREERAGIAMATPASFSGGLLHFGNYGSNYWYRGDMAAIAMWDAALPAATVRQLATVPDLAGWAGASSPRALWLFDQTDVETDLRDLVGGAHEHDRNGTTVVYADLPIPYRLSTAAVHDGSGWSDRPLLVHGGSDWINPTSVGVL